MPACLPAWEFNPAHRTTTSSHNGSWQLYFLLALTRFCRHPSKSFASHFAAHNMAHCCHNTGAGIFICTLHDASVHVYAVLGGFSVPRDILRYPAANTQNALERTIISHCILLVAGRCVVCCVCNARANYVMFWQYTCGLL